MSINFWLIGPNIVSNGNRREKWVLSIHHYAVTSLLGDSVRALVGIGATLGPLAFLDVVWPLIIVLGSLAAVFLAFACRVVGHGLCSIELSDHGIAKHGPVGRSLAWPDVTALKLAHYAAPKRSKSGWYLLTLAGGGRVLKVESTIEGFDDIVTAAVSAARRRGVAIDTVTQENLKGLGHGALGLQASG